MANPVEVVVSLASGDALDIEQPVLMNETVKELQVRVGLALGVPSCVLLFEGQILSDETVIGNLPGANEECLQVTALVDSTWEQLLQIVMSNGSFFALGLADSQGAFHATLPEKDDLGLKGFFKETYEIETEDGIVKVDENECIKGCLLNGEVPATGLRFGGVKYMLVSKEVVECLHKEISITTAVAMGESRIVTRGDTLIIVATVANAIVGRCSGVCRRTGARGAVASTRASLCAFAQQMVRSGL